MSYVFISYARNDDSREVLVKTERLGIISHLQKEIESFSGLEGVKKLTYVDRNDLKPGDHIDNTLREAIKGCFAMIVMFSPNYFSSQYCFEEWLEFEKYKNNDGFSKILIPIQFKPLKGKNKVLKNTHVSDSKYGNKTGEDWVKSIKKYEYADLTINIPRYEESENLHNLYEQIQFLVSDRLLPLKDQFLGQRSFIESEIEDNILVVKERITDNISLETKRLIENYKGKFNYSPVCIIYAGGTVGMVQADNSDEYHIDYDLALHAEDIVDELRPKLSALPFDMVFMGLKNIIDSSNIKKDDWFRLAKLLSQLMDYFQGFVILHGANTLAYTASALSFMLEGLSKPVVLTSSEVPLGHPHNDAEHNIINSIRAAAPESKNGPYPVPEVCVFSGHNLYRGNRVTKRNASDRSYGFYSPNMKGEIGKLKNEKIIIDNSVLFQRKKSFNKNISPLNAEVVIIYIYPEMNIDAFERMIDKHSDVRGVILLSYGSGNTPGNEFIVFIEDLIKKKGIIIVNITQCPYGRVELKIFETSAILFDLGIVANGSDMTLEAAYCKLLYVLSNNTSSKKVPNLISHKSKMETNLRGELSVSTHNLRLSKNMFSWNDEAGYYVVGGKTFDAVFSGNSILEAFIRFERFSILEEQDKLLEFVVYYKEPNNSRKLKDSRRDKETIVSFKKRLSKLEKDRGWFEKNLSITHSFRINYEPDERNFDFSIGLVNEQNFDFESIQIIVYTRNIQRN